MIQTLTGDITPSAALMENFDTATLFDAGAHHPTISPIDQYLENTNRLSMMYLNEPVRSAYTNDLGTVLLLGHVSAVESYLRGLIRGLVQIDEYVKKLVGPLHVTYTAAIYHEKELLPEALLEGVSFISAANISNTLKDFCGISGMGGGKVPKELKPAFDKFGEICQLRHCCVHRFGLLGADNARRLGIDRHLMFLEKPLTLSLDTLEEISSILQKFVSSLNSYVFRDVIQRTVVNSPTMAQMDEKYKQTWHFDYELDESRFADYFNLFARTKVAPYSISIWEQYDVFSNWGRACIADDAKERAGKSRKISGDAKAVAKAKEAGLVLAVVGGAAATASSQVVEAQHPVSVDDEVQIT